MNLSDEKDFSNYRSFDGWSWDMNKISERLANRQEPDGFIDVKQWAEAHDHHTHNTPIPGRGIWKSMLFSADVAFAMTDACDLTRPIIIVKLKGNFLILLDGHSRLYKAYKTGVETLPCYVIEGSDEEYARLWAHGFTVAHKYQDGLSIMGYEHGNKFNELRAAFELLSPDVDVFTSPLGEVLERLLDDAIDHFEEQGDPDANINCTYFFTEVDEGNTLMLDVVTELEQLAWVHIKRQTEEEIVFTFLPDNVIEAARFNQLMAA